MKLSSRINAISVGLVILGALLHYLVPQHGLFSNILLFLAVLLHSNAIWGTQRTIIYVILAMVIGYFAEFIGINTGWIFGPYHYNGTEDPGMLFGVPIFIPMIYGYLLYTGHFVLFAISKKLLNRNNLLILAILTGFLLTLKDLGTDPLHSTVSHVWIWNNGGAYFGVPIHNFLGWFGVFIVMTLVTVPLAWFRGGYNQQLELERGMFYMPILLLAALILFGITEGLQVSGQDQTIGVSCAFITAFTLLPYIFLAWFNGIKRS